jgi:hypothetical protein
VPWWGRAPARINPRPAHAAHAAPEPSSGCHNLHRQTEKSGPRESTCDCDCGFFSDDKLRCDASDQPRTDGQAAGPSQSRQRRRGGRCRAPQPPRAGSQYCWRALRRSWFGCVRRCRVWPPVRPGPVRARGGASPAHMRWSLRLGTGGRRCLRYDLVLRTGALRSLFSGACPLSPSSFRVAISTDARPLRCWAVVGGSWCWCRWQSGCITPRLSSGI